MFCPKCASDCGDANFCPNCGANLKGVAAALSADEEALKEREEMLPRYKKYMPDNKLGAIIAISRERPGISYEEAKQVIDELFAEEAARNPSPPRPQTRMEKKMELERSGQIYCPKCLSTEIFAERKGFDVGKAAIGAAVIWPYGLKAGDIGAKKIVFTCLKCGHQWKARKKRFQIL